MWCWWKGACAPRPAARNPATSTPLTRHCTNTPRSDAEQRHSNTRDILTRTDRSPAAFPPRRASDEDGQMNARQARQGGRASAARGGRGSRERPLSPKGWRLYILLVFFSVRVPRSGISFRGTRAASAVNLNWLVDRVAV